MCIEIMVYQRVRNSSGEVWRPFKSSFAKTVTVLKAAKCLGLDHFGRPELGHPGRLFGDQDENDPSLVVR
jgi:hypothetical protein